MLRNTMKPTSREPAHSSGILGTNKQRAFRVHSLLQITLRSSMCTLLGTPVQYNSIQSSSSVRNLTKHIKGDEFTANLLSVVSPHSSDHQQSPTCLRALTRARFTSGAGLRAPHGGLFLYLGLTGVTQRIDKHILKLQRDRPVQQGRQIHDPPFHYSMPALPQMFLDLIHRSCIDSVTGRNELT